MPLPTSVAAYLDAVPATQRALLESIRAAARAAAPHAEEALYYGMPALRVGRRWVVAYAAFTAHCSLFPLSGEILDTLADALGPWRTSKGTLRITAADPMPDALIGVLVRERLAAVAEAEAARRTPRRRAGGGDRSASARADGAEG
jgi:hypothetical protein